MINSINNNYMGNIFKYFPIIFEVNFYEKKKLNYTNDDNG